MKNPSSNYKEHLPHRSWFVPGYGNIGNKMGVRLAFLVMIVAAPALAEILPQSADTYKCQTTGGFFDFSPANAISNCRKEIEEFCKDKGKPAVFGKTVGEPSGYARYARAEISFQCLSEADIAARKQAFAENQNREIRADVENAKLLCQKDFGFIPGTQEYGTCLLKLQEQSAAARRSAKEISAQQEIADSQIDQQRRSDAERSSAEAAQAIQRLTTPPVRTNCTTFGSSTSCVSR